MKKYECKICGWVYDSEQGYSEVDSDVNIAPGTAFEDIPENWRCPICGGLKTDFFPKED